MSSRDFVRIVWIDDEPDHKEDARNLESKRRKLKIEFIQPIEFEDFLNKRENRVDLFLVDDRLILRRNIRSTFNRRGLSVAAQIRERFPEIPIYLFSAYPRGFGIYTTLAEAAESLADEILDLKKIQREGHDVLYYDAIDYRRIKESRRGSITVLLDLLDSPKDDQQRIVSALPESLKTGLSHSSRATSSTGNSIAFAKWTKRSFLKFPGFVYNPIYSATMLGMTLESFINHRSKFEGARYTGIFAKTWGNDLWWSSKLREIVFNTAARKLPGDDTTDLKRLVEKLLRLRDPEIAKCVICGKRYPDIVGINEEDETDCKPVHYRCSTKHPRKQEALYFDEIRQFKMK